MKKKDMVTHLQDVLIACAPDHDYIAIRRDVLIECLKVINRKPAAKKVKKSK